MIQPKMIGKIVLKAPKTLGTRKNDLQVVVPKINSL